MQGSDITRPVSLYVAKQRKYGVDDLVRLLNEATAQKRTSRLLELLRQLTVWGLDARLLEPVQRGLLARAGQYYSTVS